MFLSAITFGLILSFMIGPVFFVLIETSITKGFRSALSFDLGVILSDIVFIFIAYFSSFKLISQIKDEPALYIFGGALMTIFGIISYIKLQKIEKKHKENYNVELNDKNNLVKIFIKGFFLNFINIGVLGFWLGMIITFGSKYEMDTSKLFWFFSMVIGSYLGIDIIKIILAKKLKRKLTANNILLVKKISSWILIVFGGVIISKSFL